MGLGGMMPTITKRAIANEPIEIGQLVTLFWDAKEEQYKVRLWIPEDIYISGVAENSADTEEMVDFAFLGHIK